MSGAAPSSTESPELQQVFSELSVKLQNEESSAEVLLEALEKARSLNVDRKTIGDTKIGRTVGKLAQHPDPRVAQASSELITMWKKLLRGSSTVADTDMPQPKRAKTDNPTSATKKISVDTKYCGPSTKEDRRNKCREFLFKAFLEGMGEDQRDMLDVSNVGNLVAEIEEALHQAHCEDTNNPREYKDQIRAIKSNLADKKNPEFNARIYLGAIHVKYLATMASTEMASDAKKRERQKAKKDALEACQSDWDLRNVKRAEGQFPCGKCKSSETTYFQMQTRSSDEPMTTYVTCLNCGNRWKF